MCFFFLKIDPCLWISEKDAKIVSDYFPILMDSVLPIFVSNSEKKKIWIGFLVRKYPNLSDSKKKISERSESISFIPTYCTQAVEEKKRRIANRYYSVKKKRQTLAMNHASRFVARIGLFFKDGGVGLIDF